MATRAGLAILLVLLLAGSGCLRNLTGGSQPGDADFITQPKALLWDAPYASILIEVDHAPGYAPTQAALDALLTVMRDLTGKPVEIAGPTEIPAQGGDYDADAVMRIHRDTFDHAGKEFGFQGQATLHILYLDGGSRNDTFQGVYVSNGREAAAALLPDYWRGRLPAAIEAQLPGNPREFEARFERSVLIHEVGHAMGLVGGIPEVNPRQDPQNAGHSRNRDSVMFSGDVPIQTDLLYFLRESGVEPVWRFDADDVADIRAFQRTQ